MLDAFVNPPQDATRNNFGGAVGWGFIPVRSLSVSKLGRLYVTSNTQNHVVKIWQDGVTGAAVASGTVLASSPSDVNGFKYVTITPVTLTAGVRYYILSDETNGGDVWKDDWDHSGSVSSDVTHWGRAYNDTTPSAYPSNTLVDALRSYNTATFGYTKVIPGTVKTWYVSAAGSDSNDGLTTGTPFLTGNKARTVAQYFDTVKFRAGDTFAESLTFTVGVTIDSYGTGFATISPSGATQSGVVFQNCSDAWVKNVRIIGANTGTPNGGSGTFFPSRPAGVEYLNTTGSQTFYNNVGVTGCTIGGFQVGVQLAATSVSLTVDAPNYSSGYDGAVVTNNTIFNIHDSGVKTSNGTTLTSASFLRMNVSDNYLFNIWGNSTFNSGFGIFFNQAYGQRQGTADAVNVIERNVVTRVGYRADHLLAGGPYCILSCYTRGITFRRNDASDCRANALGQDGGGIDADLGTIDYVIEDNVSYNNDHAGVYDFFAGDGGVIRRNKCYNNCRLATDYGEITVHTNGDAVVHGNIVRANAGRGILLMGTRDAGKKTVLIDNVVRVAPGVPALEIQDSLADLIIRSNDFSDGTSNPIFRFLTVNYPGLCTARAALGQGIGTVGERHAHDPQPGIANPMSVEIADVNVNRWAGTLITINNNDGLPSVSADGLIGSTITASRLASMANAWFGSGLLNNDNNTVALTKMVRARQ